MKLAREHAGLGEGNQEGVQGETRAVTLNANCLCGAFLFLLFFHFSYFPVVLVALLLLLVVVYFLALKPKNPNEAKRMSSVLG